MTTIKQWDHFGNLLPQLEYSEGIRPHGEFLVAPWLPLDEAGGVFDKYVEEYFSIMPGKILAMSRDGHVVPAGLLVKYKAAASGDNVLKYTATDKEHLVLDLVTGNPVNDASVAQNGGLGYTKLEVETALKAKGLLLSSEDLEKFISSPMAVAPYGYYNAMSYSDPNQPSALKKLNFNLQHRVAILCDYVLELPWVPEQMASAQAFSALGSVAEETPNKLYYLQVTLASVLPMAACTDATPITFANDTNNLFKVKKSRKRDVKALGDYFVDDALGRIYFFHAGPLATAQSQSSAVTAQLFHYNSGSDSNIASKYTCIVGPIKPGDYLKSTAKSNFIKAQKADANFKVGTAVPAAYDQSAFQDIVADLEINAEEQAQIIGQVLDIESHPKGGRELVRTAGERLPASQFLDKLPGSATKGLPDKLTYARGANKVVRVNIIRK